jgi:hypothetical protein
LGEKLEKEGEKEREREGRFSGVGTEEQLALAGSEGKN